MERRGLLAMKGGRFSWHELSWTSSRFVGNTVIGSEVIGGISWVKDGEQASMAGDAEIRKTLDENDEDDLEKGEDGGEDGEVGRRQFGVPGAEIAAPALDTSAQVPKLKGQENPARTTGDASAIKTDISTSALSRAAVKLSALIEETTDATGNAWKRAASCSNGSASARTAAIPVENSTTAFSTPLPKAASKRASAAQDSADATSSSGDSDSDRRAPTAGGPPPWAIPDDGRGRQEEQAAGRQA
ncbi:hypothetical protein S40288_06000 [Stachybotrys chartarum IBT 40288]|nr:hypothetical protein S40288_06000 [Stachybotrys chartarum IBT 40288]